MENKSKRNSHVGRPHFCSQVWGEMPNSSYKLLIKSSCKTAKDNRVNPLKLEHPIDSARKQAHQPHTTILADSNMNIKQPQREWSTNHLEEIRLNQNHIKYQLQY